MNFAEKEKYVTLESFMYDIFYAFAYVFSEKQFVWKTLANLDSEEDKLLHSLDSILQEFNSVY